MARRRFSRRQRAAAIRNLRKARAALRRRARRTRRRGSSRRRFVRRSYRRVVRRTYRRRRFTAKARAAAIRNLAKARAARRGSSYFRRIGAKGNRRKAFKRELDSHLESGGSYSDNPYRKGKVRRYFGRRHTGTVIKTKGRYRIISKLRNGVRVTRPWKR